MVEAAGIETRKRRAASLYPLLPQWRQARSNTPSTQKKNRAKSAVLFLVEAAGIEPASEKPLTELSPGAGHLLNFPGLAADARAA